MTSTASGTTPSHNSRLIIILISMSALVSFMLLVLTLGEEGGYLERAGTLEHVRIIGEYSMDGGGWLTLKPDSDLNAHGRTELKVRGHLSADMPEGQAIMLRISNLLVTFDVNGRRMLSFGEEDTDGVVRSPGNVWKSFTSPGIGTDEAIEISLINVYPDNPQHVFDTFIDNIYAGSEFILYLRLTEWLLPNTLFSLFIIFIGFVSLILYLCARWLRIPQPPSLLYFAFSVIFMGIWFCSDFSVLSYVFPYPMFIVTTDIMCMYAFTIFFTLYVMSLRKNKAHSALYWYACFLIAMNILAVILDMCTPFDLYDFQYVWLSVVLGACVLIGFTMLYDVMVDRTTYNRIRLSAIVSLTLGGTLEVVNYVFPFTVWGVCLKTGFFLFVTFRFRDMAHFIRDSMNQARRAQELENEILQNHIDMMVSQIQPHFIFNVLNAISGLCTVNPERADDALIEFSNYLRMNIGTLQSRDPIDFEIELKHTRQYVSLEQLRFGDKIQVSYDIGYSEFSIPPLTLQPLVENAIKHGISRRARGGSVTVRTEFEGGTIHLSVTDDGEGFSAGREPPPLHGGKSAGLENVRTRLKLIAGARMETRSEPGTGTEVHVYFPVPAYPAPEEAQIEHTVCR